MGFAQTFTSKSKFLGSVWVKTFENNGVQSNPTGYCPLNAHSYKNKEGEVVQEPGLKKVIADAEKEGYNQLTFKIKTLPSGQQVIDILASNMPKK